MTDKTSLSYKDAGIDIDAGNALVERIKGVSALRRRKSSVASAASVPCAVFRPVTVSRRSSGTDGVGTKLRLAIDLKKHDTVDIDLVAMCANDLIVQGAEPLFFLDYYATGKLDVDTAATVVTGIGAGCEMSGCSYLIGGEAARDKEHVRRRRL